MAKKVICTLSFVREEGHQHLKIKIDEALEKAFSSKEKRTSKIYLDKAGKGLAYYGEVPGLRDFVENFRKSASLDTPISGLDNYGTNMFNDSGLFNFSVVRTVGISQGITLKLDKIILDKDVERWIGQFARFLKFIYGNLVGKKEILATITLEV